MFWSKLWLLLVTLAAAAAVALALVSPAPLHRSLERETGARLERAQHAASLLLKVNARQWMDAAGQVATDPVLIESLEQATRGPADLGLVHKTVQERLRYFNEKMKVDLLIATDGKGRVIARSGLDEATYKDGIEGLPLVADALRGLRGDDTWPLDGKLYRVAASPVIARDRYAGALIIGQEANADLAQSMKQKLTVDIAFMMRGRVLASSTQPAPARLPVLVDAHLSELESAGHTGPLPVDEDGHGYLTVLAPFVGEAAAHRAAYALILPRPEEPSVTGLAAGIDWHALPWMTLAPVGGGLLLALIIGFVLMRLESDRPLRRLARDAQALARGELSRLDDDRHPGKMGAVARAVNTTLDRLGPGAGRIDGAGRVSRPRIDSAPPRESPVPQRIDPTPPPRLDDDRVRRDSPPPPPVRRDSDRQPSPVKHDSGRGPSPVKHDSGRGPSPVKHDSGRMAPPPPPVPPIEVPASFGVDSGATTDERQRPEGAAPSALQSLGDTDQQPTDQRPMGGPDFVDAPLLEPLPATTTDGPAGIIKPKKHGFDEEPTVAAPSHLAALANTMMNDTEPNTQPQVKLSPEEEELDNELRAVFTEFIETKQRCGEPTESVGFEKFVVKLKANRAQLMSRYGCKTVRFQVYIKDGKAALKATPVS